MEKVFCKNAENQKQSMRSVWNYVIRKDGVGVIAAVTHDSHDTYRVSDLLTIYVVGDCSVIVSMDVAFSFGTTDRTGLCLGNKSVHVLFEQKF